MLWEKKSRSVKCYKYVYSWSPWVSVQFCFFLLNSTQPLFPCIRQKAHVTQLRIKLIWTVLFDTLNVFTSLHFLWSIGCNMQTMKSQGGQNPCEACERLDTALCSDPTRIWNISCLSLCQWTIYPLTSERKTIPPSGLFSQRTFVYSSRS